MADRHFPVGARITTSALCIGRDDVICLPGDVDRLRVSVPLPAAASGLDQPAEATGSLPAADLEGGCQAAVRRPQATEASKAPACLRHPPGPMLVTPRLPRYLVRKAQACLACALSSSVCTPLFRLLAASRGRGAVPCV